MAINLSPQPSEGEKDRQMKVDKITERQKDLMAERQKDRKKK